MAMNAERLHGKQCNTLKMMGRHPPRTVKELNDEIIELNEEIRSLRHDAQRREEALHRHRNELHNVRSECTAYIPKLARGDIVARLNGKEPICDECRRRCLFNKGTVVHITPENVARVKWDKHGKSICEQAAVYVKVWFLSLCLLSIVLLAIFGSMKHTMVIATILAFLVTPKIIDSRQILNFT